MSPTGATPETPPPQPRKLMKPPEAIAQRMQKRPFRPGSAGVSGGPSETVSSGYWPGSGTGQGQRKLLMAGGGGPRPQSGPVSRGSRGSSVAKVGAATASNNASRTASGSSGGHHHQQQRGPLGLGLMGAPPPGHRHSLTSTEEDEESFGSLAKMDIEQLIQGIAIRSQVTACHPPRPSSPTMLLSNSILSSGSRSSRAPLPAPAPAPPPTALKPETTSPSSEPASGRGRVIHHPIPPAAVSHVAPGSTDPAGPPPKRPASAVEHRRRPEPLLTGPVTIPRPLSAGGCVRGSYVAACIPQIWTSDSRSSAQTFGLAGRASWGGREIRPLRIQPGECQVCCGQKYRGRLL